MFFGINTMESLPAKDFAGNPKQKKKNQVFTKGLSMQVFSFQGINWTGWTIYYKRNYKYEVANSSRWKTYGNFTISCNWGILRKFSISIPDSSHDYW